VRKEISKRLINVFLRGLSMGSRFILIFFIAKLLAPSEVGAFGLMLATVSFSVLVVGADYYTYAQRELLARPPHQWYFVIQNQVKANLLLYSVLIPAQLLIFITGLMSWQYAVWFFSLLLLEHVAQEINRLLVAMHKQFMASIVLFVRMGSWVLIVIPLMIFDPYFQTLQALYSSWLIGCTVAIVIGIIAIKKDIPVWHWKPMDKVWLKKGFRVGGGFLLATICIKGLLTFDRYAVEALGGSEMLGAYVFYIGIVMGLYSILDPAVFSFMYPKMLQNYQTNRQSEYQKNLKELMWSTLAISLLLAAFIWFFTPYIISWINKPIYTEHLDSLD
jgi:O-antigen/teichoic acid export membrane protein